MLTIFDLLCYLAIIHKLKQLRGGEVSRSKITLPRSAELHFQTSFYTSIVLMLRLCNCFSVHYYTFQQNLINKRKSVEEQC